MTFNLFKKILVFSAVAVFLQFFFSCQNDQNTTEENIEEQVDQQIDSNATQVIMFNGALFSVPSPYQISLLIKKKHLDFNEEMINPLQNTSNYTNNFKKSLNLGVLGSDLAYLNIYEQTPIAIKYFSKIKTLSQELDISSGFDKDIIERVDKNMGNQDSLLVIISNSYRKADKFLKENNRNDLGVLILTGGFVESLYSITQLSTDINDQDLLYRIGEQKNPLENLIKVISPYYNQSEDYSKLSDMLIDLAYDFDGIDVNYTYEEPTVDVKNKLTVINSKSEVVISEEQLTTIREKVAKIRSFIIE